MLSITHWESRLIWVHFSVRLAFFLSWTSSSSLISKRGNDESASLASGRPTGCKRHAKFQDFCSSWKYQGGGHSGRRGDNFKKFRCFHSLPILFLDNKRREPLTPDNKTHNCTDDCVVVVVVVGGGDGSERWLQPCESDARGSPVLGAPS